MAHIFGQRMTLKRNWVISLATPRGKISKLKREKRQTGGGNLPADCFVTPLEVLEKLRYQG